MERTAWVLSRRLKQRGDTALLCFRQTHPEVVWGWEKGGRIRRPLPQSRGKEKGGRAVAEGGCRAACRALQRCAGTNRREHHFMGVL